MKRHFMNQVSIRIIGSCIEFSQLFGKPYPVLVAGTLSCERSQVSLQHPTHFTNAVQIPSCSGVVLDEYALGKLLRAHSYNGARALSQLENPDHRKITDSRPYAGRRYPNPPSKLALGWNAITDLQCAFTYHRADSHHESCGVADFKRILQHISCAAS